MDDLDRLFQYLVNHLAHDAPQYLERSFQVSELYQKLIPYRYHRDALGFGSADDYEAAMLRLLAGERQYANVDPVDAQQAMAKEAQMPHPSHGTFREYAAATVTLERGAIKRFMRSDVAYAPPAPAPSAADAFTPPPLVDPAVPTPPPTSVPSPPTAPQTAPAPPMPEPTSRQGFVFEPVAAGPSCPGCSESLPTDRDVCFCPFCGLRIGTVGCRQCGEPIEAHWRYCVACGIAFDG